jgi:hypothetical protein
MGWWLVLYWPIMGGLFLLGRQAEKRYSPGSKERNRADLALGFALIAMPSAPLIIFIGMLVFRSPNDPIIKMFGWFVIFWICVALFYGALAKLSSARRAVEALRSWIRAPFSN